MTRPDRVSRSLASTAWMLGHVRLHLRHRFSQFRRLREALRARVPLAELIAAAERIRSTSDVLALAPTITNPHWMGVNRATHALFPGRVLELPHAFGGSLYTPEELRRLCRHLADQQFSQVILSGFPAYFELIARSLREHGVKTGCLFHGFLSECGLSQSSADAFAAILRLRREGVLAKIACNKRGLPETIERIARIPVHPFMLPTKTPSSPVRPTIDRAPGEIHIGVLGGGRDPFRKNVHTQVAAALLIEGVKVHVTGDPHPGYWGCDRRLVRQPSVMPHDDYLNVLGQMDVNLHLSYSESWGQVTAESLAMGVPCLIANHSGIYDHDAWLRERLVSAHFDDPIQMSSDLLRVLAEREMLSVRARAYVQVLNAKAHEYLEAFLAQ